MRAYHGDKPPTVREVVKTYSIALAVTAALFVVAFWTGFLRP